MINILQNVCMCILKDIVDVKQLLDQKLTSIISVAYKHHIILVMSNSVENSMQDGLPTVSNFQATLNALISHINFSMYNILVFC